MFVIQADIIQILLIFVPGNIDPFRFFASQTNLGVACVPICGILADRFHCEEQLLDTGTRAEEQYEENKDGHGIPDLSVCGARQEQSKKERAHNQIQTGDELCAERDGHAHDIRAGEKLK